MFPYEIKSFDSATNAELLKCYTGEKTGFVQVGPKKWSFPSGYAQEAEKYYNLELRPDDVFVVTFPRSGTTWTQEMVWLLCNDLDYARASAVKLPERFPILEMRCFIHPEIKRQFLEKNKHDPEKYKQVQEMDRLVWKELSRTDGPRFIKSHLPLSLLPPNLLGADRKVIYVARNPKDVAVSFYHLNRSLLFLGFEGDFKQYWNCFQNNLQPWTPYWEHIKEGWSKRHHKNLHFMFYEDMNSNLKSELKKLANFLGKSYTDEQMDRLEDHLKIDNFRQNKSVNNDRYKELNMLKPNEEEFVRKGKSGGWKDYFDQELNEKADAWIANNLNDTDLKFPS